ncbi:MAG: hypothetical protein WC530_11230 [Candidatus Omnitrophota bacterium]|jgi:hypothetical protein
MPKQLDQNIKPVELLPIQTLADSANGSAIDTHLADESSFETALIKAAVGDLGSQATTKIKIQEDDDSAFSAPTTAEGGAEVTVSADSTYSFEIRRAKRYLRAVVTLTTPGATPKAEVHVSGILCNWDLPFPIL